MAEPARFQKDEGPKEPGRPGYKGGIGRCLCEMVKAGGLSQRLYEEELDVHTLALSSSVAELSRLVPPAHHMILQSPVWP